MSTIKGLANVWVPVQDTDRAVDFYENTFGLPVVKRDGPWAEVDAGQLTIGFNGREPEGAQSGGGPVITFQPEGGLEDAISSLQEQGVEFSAGVSEHDWGRIAALESIRNYKTSIASIRCSVV